jgi:hypothetical protein
MQPAVVSGPSILGLGADSQEQADTAYLLDDEPRARLGGFLLFFVVLLLLAATAFVAYRKYYFVVPFAESAPLQNAPALAYERTPASVWEQAKLGLPAADLVLPTRTLIDQLALENIAATMKNARASASPASEKGGRLLSEGEKYLYGRGVITNCQVATKNFEDSANAGNAKAMAHLGSMYGSGRCVKFDRVTAYGWFAKAKDADPDNTWLESSMDMLWRNMSTKERAAILK